MALKPGYRSAPGTARRVITPTGETISHRQYRNLSARQAGWRSLSEAESDPHWAAWRFKMRKAGRRPHELTRESKLAADYVKVKRAREKRPPKMIGRTASGKPIWRKDRSLEPIGKELGDTPLGRLLAASGAADDSDIWTSGGTP